LQFHHYGLLELLRNSKTVNEFLSFASKRNFIASGNGADLIPHKVPGEANSSGRLIGPSINAPCCSRIKMHEHRYEKRFTFRASINLGPPRATRHRARQNGTGRDGTGWDEMRRCEALRKSTEAKSGRVELFS